MLRMCLLKLLLCAGVTTALAHEEGGEALEMPATKVEERTRSALQPTTALLFNSGVAVEIPNATLQEAVNRPGDQFILVAVRVTSRDGDSHDLFLEVPEVQFRDKLTRATTLRSTIPFDGLGLERTVFGHSSDSDGILIDAKTEIRDRSSRPKDSDCPLNVDCIWKESTSVHCTEVAVVAPAPPAPVRVVASEEWTPMPFLQRIGYTPPKEIDFCRTKLVWGDFGRRSIGVSTGVVFTSTSSQPQPPVRPPAQPPVKPCGGY